MTADDVSIVIPCRNRHELLSVSIASCIAQTAPPKEIIVIDDASDPPLATFIDEYFEQRANIRVIRNERACGANLSRNVGVRAAVTALVAFQDSDDIWLPDKLSKQLEAFNTDPAPFDSKLVYTKLRKTYLDNTSRIVPPAHVDTTDPASALLRGNFISTQTVLASRALLIEHPFHPAMPRFQDWELWLRLASEIRFVEVALPLVQATETPSSITRDSVARADGLAMLLKLHKESFSNDRPAQSHFARATAAAYARLGRPWKAMTWLFRMAVADARGERALVGLRLPRIQDNMTHFEATPADLSSTPHGAVPILAMVTYHSERFLSDIVDTAARYLDLNPRAHFSVVENSLSKQFADSLRARLRSYADRVTCVVPDSNIGFAPGVNLAVSEAIRAGADPTHVILLNPDVMTDGDTVHDLNEAALRHKLAVSSPVIRDPRTGALDRGLARRRWNWRRLFAEVAGSPAIANLLLSRRRNIPIGRSVVTDADIVSGAFMCIDVAVFGTGLDVRLPMYLEDQEICHRAARQRQRVGVVNGLMAAHLGGESRKANLEAQRVLRMMELAEAPTMALLDWSRHSRSAARLAVLSGGAVRYVIALIAQIFGTGSRRTWALDQQQLAKWFMAWAIDPETNTARILTSADKGNQK